MTPKYFKDKIKEIQIKYPLSFTIPPRIGIIQYVDNNDNVILEKIVGNLSIFDIEEYEEQAKESHQLSLSIQQHRSQLHSPSPIFDISDMD